MSPPPRRRTLDTLTGARLDLGIGVCWLRDELDALGVEFSKWNARLTEMLLVARRLWPGRPVEQHSPDFDFAAWR